jgi:ubiquinone/menaquinone biosynthesis C-methylase UbiE
MDWSASYGISRSLTLEVSRNGKLVGAPSLSRRPSELDPEALPAFLEFAAGSTPRAAFERLRQEWEVEEAGFEEMVDALLDQGFLVTAEGGAGAGLPSEWFGAAASHFGMLRDTVRVMSYRAAIEKHSPGQRVVEIGCGTGILSLFAAKAGARKVIAIEEGLVSEVAAAMFEANGCSETIELRVANSRNVEISEPADLIIHEILGVDPFDENLLPVLLDARRRFLRPGGRLLPYRLEVCCLGIESQEDPQTGGALTLAKARELSGFYGLDFGPFLKALEAHQARADRSRVVIGDKPFDRRILSEEVQILDLDLQEGDLDLVGWTASACLHIVAEGTLNGVVLFFRAHLDEDLRVTNSPYAPLTSWGWDLRFFSRSMAVSPGDQVALVAEIDSAMGRQKMVVDIA